MNAVLLKELRQGVRNRYVLAAYLIFIVVLLVVAGTMTASAVRESVEHPIAAFGAGRALFLVLHGIFVALAMLFIPVYVAIRIVRERWGTNIDLMYVTPMPPSALLSGKLVLALALAGLFLGAVLPFLALSYFVGGIDVPSIVITVPLTLLVVTVATLYAILLAVAPMPKVIRGLGALGLLITLVYGTGVWIAGAAGLCSEGYMSILGEVKPRIMFVEVVAMAVSAAALLYAGGLAGFRPVNVDRMRPLRLLGTVLFVVWWGVIAAQSRDTFFADANKPLFLALTVFTVGMMVLGLSERTEPGNYLRDRVPRSLLARALGYPFRTGQLNAVCWTALLLAAGIALSYALFPVDMKEVFCQVCRTVHARPCNTTFAEGVRVFALNVSGYALSMLVLWHYALRRRMSNAHLWWVTLLAFILLTIAFGALKTAGAEGLDKCIGYAFAQRHIVLPWLYAWNAAMLVCLVPAYLGLPQSKKQKEL